MDLSKLIKKLTLSSATHPFSIPLIIFYYSLFVQSCIFILFFKPWFGVGKRKSSNSSFA